jgi:hypothetical protein
MLLILAELDVMLGVAGLVLAGAFAAHVRRAAHPLIPRAAFASANLRTGTALSFVNTATTSSAGVLATLLLQDRLGVSSVGAGLALAPFSLGVIAGASLSNRGTRHALAATGLAGIAAGNLLLAATYGSVPGILAGVLVAGAGLGVASVAATEIGTDVDDALGGTASGVLNTGAQLGTALGVAALLVLAESSGTALAWTAAAALAAATALSCLGSAAAREVRADREAADQ